MTKKEWKRLASIVGICSLLSIFGGCQNDAATPQETASSAGTTEIQQSQTQETPSVTTSTAVTEKQLSISNRCIGCGKCTRIAPETFAMNGRQATVISQEQIDTAAVQQAIQNCPAQAIQIIEA